MNLPGEELRIGGLLWTQWPTLPLPTEAWLVERARERGIDWVVQYHRTREQGIVNERNDPLEYGWEQPPLRIVRALLAGTYRPGEFGTATVNAAEWVAPIANDIVMLGGNGSAKTDIQARIAMEVLVKKKGCESRCFSQNETTSHNYIQRAMFRYLHPELRGIKREGQTTKISYSRATGFSKEIFVLPNESTCSFPTYKAWMQDRNSVEGGECAILTWDEEAPGELLDTVRFRAFKTGGFVLGGFTPLQGYTETVGQYVEGARIIETIPARAVVWDWHARTWAWGEWILPEHEELVKGCPDGHVPFVLQSSQGDGRRFAVVLPTFFNPYTNVAEVMAGTAGKSKEFKLERLWGWATNRVRKAFADFSDAHIVKEWKRIPPRSEMTIYFWTDPHGTRNWFTLWLGVHRDGRIFVLKEWPDISVGEWAVPGPRPDGKAGPGQTSQGSTSFNFYKQLFLEKEGWAPGADGVWAPRGGRMGEGESLSTPPEVWRPMEPRYMDPRPAGTDVPSDDQAETYLDHMFKPVVVQGKTIVPGLYFVAGPHCGIEEGNQLINDWISGGWNPKEPITPLNCPRFYVYAGCQNLIYALRTYTGADGEKGATKDPIDCLKGPAKLGIRHYESGTLGSVAGSGHSY